MAEIRFNYGDKFTQTTDTNTGIGPTNRAAKLDIAGGTSAGSLRVSGIATLSSYQGFVNTKLTPTENIIDFITISTTGNAHDFGDVAFKTYSGGGCSDSHGGLGGY